MKIVSNDQGSRNLGAPLLILGIGLSAAIGRYGYEYFKASKHDCVPQVDVTKVTKSTLTYAAVGGVMGGFSIWLMGDKNITQTALIAGATAAATRALLGLKPAWGGDGEAK